jgi:m7GpppX diphosphatase
MTTISKIDKNTFIKVEQNMSSIHKFELDINEFPVITNTEVIQNNDRFGKNLVTCDTKLIEYTISQATDRDIVNNRTDKIKPESYDDYLKDTFPKISISTGAEWVYNILDGITETDKVLHTDDKFMLLPDLRWNGDVSKLYCLAIVRQRDIFSIRELSADHVPLLEHMKNTSLDIIEKQFNVKKENLRMYFHYHPSTWHLHLHINVLSLNTSSSVEYSYELGQVIQNLKIDSNYYKKIILDVKY